MLVKDFVFTWDGVISWHGAIKLLIAQRVPHPIERVIIRVAEATLPILKGAGSTYILILALCTILLKVTYFVQGYTGGVVTAELLVRTQRVHCRGNDDEPLARIIPTCLSE